MIACVRMVEFYVGGLDVKFPARRHGVPRIHLSSPSRRGSIFSMSDTSEFKLRTEGVRTCCLLKASNWRVNEAARWPAFSIFVAYS